MGKMFDNTTVRITKMAKIPTPQAPLPHVNTCPGFSSLLLEAPDFKTEVDTSPWWVFSETRPAIPVVEEEPTDVMTFVPEMLEPERYDPMEDQPTGRFKTDQLVPLARSEQSRWQVDVVESAPRRLTGYSLLVLMWGVIVQGLVAMRLVGPG